MSTQVLQRPALREGAFGNATHLSCRECGATHVLGPFYACPECFGPLEIAYDFPQVTRAQIEAGPANIWRYRSLLPVPTDIVDSPNMEPGFTRLLRAGNLGRELGIDRLWVKDDSGNPTHSFKDRVVAIALSAARELGSKVFACPSTGNLANAVAAAGARAGIPTVVFIPHDLEVPKIVASAIYTNRLVAVRGNYDDVNRLASEIAGEEDGWAFVNVNVRPYYAEGSKTLGYEVAEQLGWRLPDNVVIPVASGSQLTKVDKAFQELIRLGLVEEKPYRIFGAQATGCSPVSAAFKDGHDVVRPVRPATIAKSLAIGNPADGPYVLDVARRTGGAVEDVDDELVREGIELLARTEGVFAETAGGVTVAVLKKLVETGQLDPDGDTVVFNTGDGLKTLDAVADRVGPAATIDPSYDAFVAGRTLDRRDSDRERNPMSVSVRIPTILRTYTGGESEVTADGSTLAEVLDDLESNHSGIKARVLDEQGAIRRFVNVYVGNDDVRFLESLETPTPEGVQISIIPAVAGGGSRGVEVEARHVEGCLTLSARGGSGADHCDSVTVTVMALDRMHWLGHGEPAMIETVRGAQDQWQAIGLATAIASAVLVGAVLLAAIRPSGREHGPALLVLLVTLLLASLVVLSVGQSEVALGFEISVLGLGLGVVTVVQAASGTTPGPRWRNALAMLPAAGLVVGGILLETDSTAGFTWTFAAIAVGLAVAVERAWTMVTSGAG